MANGNFLLGAGLLLGALALAGFLFTRLRQSVVPGFILLGIAARPWGVDEHMVDVLATLGVVLLLFLMGVEFSLGALLRNRRRILRGGAIDLVVCFPAGFLAGVAMGWGWTGGLILAGAFYASSSAIVSKSIIETRRTANPETESALGVLVFEDLLVALLLAVLSGAVLSPHPAPINVAWGAGKALLFFGAAVGAALWARPLLDRAFDLESDDLFVLLAGSVLLMLSWAAMEAGLSEAIGAFLAGLALAETTHKERIERLFGPLQGLFAAVFFLAFGLSIDPGSFAAVWPQALSLTLLGVALKVAAGWWIGRSDGLAPRCSLSLGLTLVPRGEFSIVLAGLAAAAGYAELAALVALLVLSLSLVGTATIRLAPRAGRLVFPRRRERELGERGFSPDLAGFDPPAGSHAS